MIALLARCRARKPWIDRLGDTMPRGYTVYMMLLMQDLRLDVNNKDMDGRTPLIHAVHNSNQEVMDMLIDTMSA